MNSGTTLYEEAVALRAEVREVVAILENWTQTADRNHANRSWPKGRGQCKRDNAGGTPALCVTSPGDSPIGRGDGSAKTPATRTADLDPVPHP